MEKEEVSCTSLRKKCELRTIVESADVEAFNVFCKKYSINGYDNTKLWK